MFTFRLNNHTKGTYSEILKIHNNLFNTKFTIQNIIPYAVNNFLKNGNSKFLKHYNLVTNYTNQDFIIQKETYLKLKKYIKNDITLQDLLNFSLNLYIIPFKAITIKDSMNKDRMLILLNNFNFLNTGFKIKNEQGYKTNFIITQCPVCGHNGFYVNSDNLQVGCYNKKDCLINTSSLSDIISVITYKEKVKYPELISIIYELVIKNFSKNISKIENSNEIIKYSSTKSDLTKRIKELENNLSDDKYDFYQFVDFIGELDDLKKQLNMIIRLEDNLIRK